MVQSRLRHFLKYDGRQRIQPFSGEEADSLSRAQFVTNSDLV